jgi:hypothetical protein
MEHLDPAEFVPATSTIEPSTIDADLACPCCDYNLRGLTESRCPECGEPFDRQRLHEWAMTANLPLLFTRSGRPYPYKSMMMIALLAPSLLGRELPPAADVDEARRHGRRMRWGGIIVFGALTLTWFLTTGEWVLPIVAIAIMVPVSFAATLLCEALTAALLARFVKPLHDQNQAGQPTRFWRSLCYCLSAHFPLTCLGIGLMNCMGGIGALAIIVSFVWWWLGIGRAVWARSLPSAGRVVALLLIPVVVFASAAVGYLQGAIMILFLDLLF